jgi:hypothetical protein
MVFRSKRTPRPCGGGVVSGLAFLTLDMLTVARVAEKDWATRTCAVSVEERPGEW